MSVLILRIIIGWFVFWWLWLFVIKLSRAKLKTAIFIIVMPVLIFTKNGRIKLSKLLKGK